MPSAEPTKWSGLSYDFYPGIQATQVQRVNTTMTKDSKRVSADHLYDEEKPTEMKASNLHKPAKLTQTSPIKIEEKPKITPQTDEYALKQVDDVIPVQVSHSKAQNDEQQLQLISTKPKERAINSSDLILLLERKVPNLTVTLHQEEPGADSDKIVKLIPCDVANLLETSVHSGFQEQFAIFDIDKFSKFARKFSADFYLSYVDTYLPSTPIQPALKPPWIFHYVFLLQTRREQSTWNHDSGSSTQYDLWEKLAH